MRGQAGLTRAPRRGPWARLLLPLVVPLHAVLVLALQAGQRDGAVALGALGLLALLALVPPPAIPALLLLLRGRHAAWLRVLRPRRAPGHGPGTRQGIGVAVCVESRVVGQVGRSPIRQGLLAVVRGHGCCFRMADKSRCVDGGLRGAEEVLVVVGHLENLPGPG